MENNMLVMDRSTTLQRLACVVGCSVLMAIFYFNVNLAEYKNQSTLEAYFLIVLSSSVLFYLLNVQPFSKIFFDYNNDQISYYRFLLFKKNLPLSAIADIKGQTKISHEYGGGKSRTLYTTDVFLISDDKDYQLRVFERAKIQEFEVKFEKAKSLLTTSGK